MRQTFRAFRPRWGSCTGDSRSDPGGEKSLEELAATGLVGGKGLPQRGELRPGNPFHAVEHLSPDLGPTTMRLHFTTFRVWTAAQ